MLKIWKSMAAVFILGASLSSGIAGASTAKVKMALPDTAPDPIGIHYETPNPLSKCVHEYCVHTGPIGHDFILWPIVASDFQSMTRHSVQFSTSEEWDCGDPITYETYLRNKDPWLFDFAKSAGLINFQVSLYQLSGYTICSAVGESVAEMQATALLTVDAQGVKYTSPIDWHPANIPNLVTPHVSSPISGKLTIWWSDSEIYPPATAFLATVTAGGSSSSCQSKKPLQSSDCGVSNSSIAFRNLKSCSPYTLTLRPVVQSGSASSITVPGVYPLQDGKLTMCLKNSAVSPSASFMGALSGVIGTASITIGKSQVQCVPNQFSQCEFTLPGTKSGTWTIYAKTMDGRITTPLWVPAVTLPKSVAHGKSFSAVISHAPPNASVVLTTSDGRTINTAANRGGGVSIQVKTTTRALISINISVGGTPLGPYRVQVS